MVAVSNVFKFSHYFSGALAFGNGQVNVSSAFTAGRTFPSQLFESSHTSFVTCTAGFNAFPDPYLFLRQQLVELGILLHFGFKPFRFTFLPLGEIARKANEFASIEFDNARCYGVKKSAVVRY